MYTDSFLNGRTASSSPASSVAAVANSNSYRSVGDPNLDSPHIALMADVIMDIEGNGVRGGRVESAPLGSAAAGGTMRRAELERVAQQVTRNALIIRLIDFMIHVAILISEQMTFKGSWSKNNCDYDLRIWATVWLGNSTARSALHLCKAAYQLIWMSRGLARRDPCLNFIFKQPLLDLFSMGWFIYGIFPLFVSKEGHEPLCDLNRYHARDWAMTGWILQAITYFLPCILILICVPCLLCALRVGWIRRRLSPLIFGQMFEASTNQQPAPDTVIAKLKTVTFTQALDEDLIDPGGIIASGGTINPMPEDNGSRANASNDAISQSLLSAAIPSTIGQAVMNSLLRGNSTEIPPNGNPTGTLVRTASNNATPPSPSRAYLVSLEEGNINGGVSPPTSPAINVHRPPGPVVEGPQSSSSAAAAAAAAAGTSLSCPICFTEYQPDDMVMLLPCDPRRHVFHEGCIKECLRKSQHCPMCRMNIVDLINLREQASTTDGAIPQS